MRARIRLAGGLFIGLCTLGLFRHACADSGLPPAQNLSAEARVAEDSGQPLILLYSLPGCPHCEVVRKFHLKPLHTSKTPTVHIRQIDISSSRPLIDFQGRITTHQQFAKQEGITLTPVVALLDARGRALAEPLVGTLLPDYYGAYLDQALTRARAALNRTRETRY